MDEAAPIGVFDSGVGGLSVLREIRRELPHERLLYVADSGWAPYGERDAGFIAARSVTIARFLVDQGVKAIVVACNTASGAAADRLRSLYALPIVAIEPAVKPAAALTRSHVVGVLATSATLASAKFATLVDRHGRNVRVVVRACPGLAEQVEAGDLSGPATRTLVERYVAPLIDERADVLVMGCTHYTFLTPLVQEIAGAGVTIVDPASAVAREMRRRLTAEGLLRTRLESGKGDEAFWSSGDLDVVSRVIDQLWGPHAPVLPLPSITPA